MPQSATDPARNDRLKHFFQASASPTTGRTAAAHVAYERHHRGASAGPDATLVVRSRDLKLVPAESVREFADLIPGARLREIPGDAAVVFAVDVELVADILEEFITGAPPPARRIASWRRSCSLTSSTPRARREIGRPSLGGPARASPRRHRRGDQRVWREDDQDHRRRRAGALHRSGAGRALRAADHHRRRRAEPRLRTGLHTGEVERTSDDVAGLAVHLAARIPASPMRVEILVSPNRPRPGHRATDLHRPRRTRPQGRPRSAGRFRRVRLTTAITARRAGMPPHRRGRWCRDVGGGCCSSRPAGVVSRPTPLPTEVLMTTTSMSLTSGSSFGRATPRSAM